MNAHSDLSEQDDLASSSSLFVDSSCSNSNHHPHDQDTCPICIEPLGTEDTVYPLQCETKVCHFNMCYSCTEKFLKVSHEGLQVASDGNVFLTKLQCPSCRGAFLVDLEDILLLREHDRQRRLKLIKDSELNAKDLRKKHHVNDEKLADIDRAKDVYLRATMKRSGIIEDDIELYMSKLDLKQNQTKDDNSTNDNQKKKIRYIDEMVLCGLESSMSEAERDFIVQLMTSGCTTKMVQAAQLISSIVRMNAQKRREGMASTLPPSRSVGTSNTPSQITSHKRPSQPYIRPQSPSYSFRMSSASYLMKRCAPPSYETDAKQRLKWGNMYPLPFRMPRANRLDLDFDPRDTKQSLIRFMDDEESLSFLKYNEAYSKMSYENRCLLIRDAFSTFSFSPRGKMKKTDGSRFDGAENILLHLEHKVEDRMESDRMVSWRRVFVSFVHGKLQRRTGLRVGDVVTHLNGEPFDGNAEKLRFLLAAKKTEETIGGGVPTVEIITNAELSVAEVLRLRSLAVRNQDDDESKFKL